MMMIYRASFVVLERAATSSTGICAAGSSAVWSDAGSNDGGSASSSAGVPQVAVMVVPKAVRQVTEMLAPGRS